MGQRVVSVPRRNVLQRQILLRDLGSSCWSQNAEGLNLSEVGESGHYPKDTRKLKGNFEPKVNILEVVTI